MLKSKFNIGHGNRKISAAQEKRGRGKLMGSAAKPREMCQNPLPFFHHSLFNPNTNGLN